MKYKLRIHNMTPETMPFEQLMEYSAVFASLLGDKKKVHLINVENRSVAPVFHISPDQEDKAHRNITSLRLVDCPKSVKNNVIKLKSLANRDNVQVDVMCEDTVVYQIQPEAEPELLNLETEHITIRGQLIRIGGKDNSMHFTLKDLHTNEKFDGEVEEELAKKLAQYFLNGEIDVSGWGNWEAKKGGGYKLASFKADNFTSLADGSTYDVFDLLKKVGSGWADNNDPIKDAIRMRREQ